MNYEAFCFALGHTTLWFLAGFITYGVAINSWYYFSTGVALWLARVLSNRKYPGFGGVSPKYTKMFLWRTRMLFRIVFDWRMIAQAHGGTVSNNCWVVNLTGFFPKVRVK